MFEYPATDATPNWLKQYNRLAQTNGFHRGKFGFAMDVFRDGHLMYRNYDLAETESLDDWCRRNYPSVANPDYSACGMGVPLVHGLDTFPVPTRAACVGNYSLQAIRDIVQAALATAQYPFPPSHTSVVPLANALRQRFMNTDSDWIKVAVADVESGVSIRAIILHKGATQEPVKTAQWTATLERREGSTLESKLQPLTASFSAPRARLNDLDHRKPVLKEARKACDIVGMNGRVTEATPTRCVFALGAHPFNLVVSHVEDHPDPVIEKDTGTLDL